MSNTFLPSHAGVTKTHAIHTHARAHAHTQTRTRYYSLSLPLVFVSAVLFWFCVLNSLRHYVDIFLDNPHTFRRALLHTPKSSTTRRKRQHSVETTTTTTTTTTHGFRSNGAKRGPFGESVIEGGRPTQRMVSNETNCDVIEATVRFCIIIGMQRNDGTH